jgi:N-acetylglucosamine malate deacetylase 1
MVEFVNLDAQVVTSPKKRVLLVDDHAVVRKGLAVLINEEPGMQVCGDAEDEQSALETVVRLRPDVAVVDWSLGQKDASDLIRKLHETRPEIPVLVLSMHDELFYAERVLRLGARGYVMKRDATKRIIESIRRMAEGQMAFTDRAIAALPEDLKAELRKNAASTRPKVESGGSRRFAGPQKGSKGDLVIAPHPDDETFGCGGTIRLVAESGTGVDVVFMTRGELGHEEGQSIDVERRSVLAKQRTNEAVEACKALGVQRISFLGGNDTRLEEQRRLAEDLLLILERNNYRRVFCPWKYDGHTDHKATFCLLQVALKAYPASLQIWLYEVWTPLGFNMLIPIDGTIAHKKKAIDHYCTQSAQRNYREGFLGLSAYRSAFCPPANFAEAFFVCSKEELLTL